MVIGAQGIIIFAMVGLSRARLLHLSPSCSGKRANDVLRAEDCRVLGALAPKLARPDVSHQEQQRQGDARVVQAELEAVAGIGRLNR